MNWSTGLLLGSPVQERTKTLGQLRGIFYDADSWARTDPDTTVYRVRWWQPVPENTEGGLFWGTTTIEPGLVGDEYFMTHGHCHQQRNRAEIYSTITGEGALVLADAGGRTWMEAMTAGSIHYVRGEVAHRVANVGKSPLVFVACWPSDAGHDYETIATKGFPARLICRHEVPTLLRNDANGG